MAANPTRYFTVEQYLAVVEAGGPTLEYWDGDILMMGGGKREHARISGNVYASLHSAVQKPPCEAFPSDQAINTPTLPVFHFADASVACDAEFQDHQGFDVLTNPVLIVEVISETSRLFDHGRKFEAYKAISTFREYLLIEQKEHRVTHWQKIAGEWISAIITDGVIRLAAVDYELKMVNIYDGV